MHSKNYESKKAKTTYILERRKYVVRLEHLVSGCGEPWEHIPQGHGGAAFGSGRHDEAGVPPRARGPAQPLLPVRPQRDIREYLPSRNLCVNLLLPVQNTVFQAFSELTMLNNLTDLHREHLDCGEPFPEAASSL